MYDFFFCFKQKTAYEMRISDWSSDVCSSDLEAAIAALTSVKGIGRWTAEIYLLFALGRPDVLPAGDLALCVAAQHLKGLETRPSPRTMAALAEEIGRASCRDRVCQSG